MSIPKYRAFNRKTKEMEPVLLICFVNEYVNVLPERNLEGGNQEEWSFSDIELLPFIGLFDKHDKPIYEGDLIYSEPITTANLDLDDDKWICKVQYHEASFSFFDLEGFVDIIEEEECHDEMEIIGNFYQNPELLK